MAWQSGIVQRICTPGKRVGRIYTPGNCFNITYIPWEVHARNIAAGPASWKKCTRCPNATEFQPMGPGNICAAKNGRI